MYIRQFMDYALTIAWREVIDMKGDSFLTFIMIISHVILSQADLKIN